MHTCNYVVDYEQEPAGSDVSDPRIRCGELATVCVGDGTWLCEQHARIVEDQGEVGKQGST